MFKINELNANYLVYFRRHLREQGLDVDALDIKAGIPKRLDKKNEIDNETLIRGLEVYNNATNDRHRGLWLAMELPPTIHHVLGYGVLTAPTLLEAAAYSVRFQALTTSVVLFEIERIDKQFCLKVTTRDYSASVESFLVDAAMGSIRSIVKAITQQEQNATRIELSASDKEIEAIYKQYFDCDIVINSEANRYFIRSDLLSVRSPFANEVAFRNAWDQCEALCDSKETRVDITSSIKGLIIGSIAAPPLLPEAANMLDISPRTLRYLLSKKGTSYQKLVRQCKIDVAKNLLNDDQLNLAHVAYRLGYAEPSNFSSAFKKWTGISPKEFRRQPDKSCKRVLTS